eukprot:scpid102777/ scgid13053/ 
MFPIHFCRALAHHVSILKSVVGDKATAALIPLLVLLVYRWSNSPGHLVTWSPGHLVTWSPGHLVTWSPGHLVTWSKRTLSLSPVVFNDDGSLLLQISQQACTDGQLP